MTKIELLSPARDLQTGKEAILHGADAVYIGAPRFGARAAAGNSVEDISELVEFAHLFGVRVYVTLNTVLFDDEVDEAIGLALVLQRIGVDALIVQDFALIQSKRERPEGAGEKLSIPFHASTQMDNRTAEKVMWLSQQGFEQAVLARELTLEETAEIHKKVPQMALEAFVHGATCVSYNGQCYASQHCFGRSANRGECAQFCRLPFDLLDEEGNELKHQCHLLSLHDMNRSDDLEALLDAGVTSLKIEGRLKDTSYVKNVTAYYRQRLDEIVKRRPEDYQRSSVGTSKVTFTPNLSKSFNRGFSNYFMHGRTADMVQQATPKSMGERVGQVKEVRRGCFTVSGIASFSNGDGLCFLDDRGILQGFRVNRVDGNCLYPKEMPLGLRPRQILYRNHDHDFEQLLSHSTATRKIAADWSLKRVEKHDDGESLFRLTMVCEDGVTTSKTFALEVQPARSAQYDAVRRQLERMGDTIYETRDVELDIPFDNVADCFMPASILAVWRRELATQMDEARRCSFSVGATMSAAETEDNVSMEQAFAGKLSAPRHLTYLANVANAKAHNFCLQQGMEKVDNAMEVDPQRRGDVLMTTRYCVRFELGLCPKHHGVRSKNLMLRSADGRCFPLNFDCHRCEMQVMTDRED